jgi:RNA polymerase sigma-70 factor (ECF subfamily)
MSDRLAERQARFNTLVIPNLDRLLAFALRRTEARADADDAVQETCVRAWIGFDQLREPARVRAWLYRLLRTVLSDAGERVARRRSLVSITRLESAHEELVGGDADALFDEVAARLSSEAVRDALAQIPDDFAMAVELHDMEGFTYLEIAEIVGVPIGTIMSRISRGRRLVAGALLASRSTTAAAAAPAVARRQAPPSRGGGPR